MKTCCARFCLTLVLALSAPGGEIPVDWRMATPAKEGLDPERLSGLDSHIRSRLPHMRSLLIARHGRLVIENYYADASRDGLHNMQSMSKSISSALVGIAVQKGLIRSLDDPIVDYFPAYRNGIQDERMNSITVRHLLTMSSGINESRLSFDRLYDNPVAEILKQRLLFTPGQGFKYSSPAAHMLGGVLRQATGKPPFEFAESEIFRPLGMGPVEWYADKTGLQSGGMSALFRSRDLLKFGELYLRKGRWAGREIVPSRYVAESIETHNSGGFLGRKVRYGYMWWIDTIAGHDLFYAAGYGGQYLVVISDLDLVVLCTSDWKQPEYPEHFALLQKFILPSVTAK